MQNQWSTPSTTAWTVSGPTVTVIPHTGSTAWAGAGATVHRGAATSPSTRMLRTISRQDRQARSRARCARRCRARRARAPARPPSGVRSSSASSASPRVRLQTTPTNPTPAVERRPDRPDLVAPVGGRRPRRSPAWRGASAAGRPRTRAAGASIGDRVGDRRGADQVQERRGQQRLEVDLQRSARQARVDHDARTGRLREDVVAVGQHPQQHALAPSRGRRAPPSAPTRRRSDRRRSPRSSRRPGRSPGRPARAELGSWARTTVACTNGTPVGPSSSIRADRAMVIGVLVRSAAWVGPAWRPTPATA